MHFVFDIQKPPRRKGEGGSPASRGPTSSGVWALALTTRNFWRPFCVSLKNEKGEWTLTVRSGTLPAHPFRRARLLLTWYRRRPGAPCERHTVGAPPTWYPWRSELWRARASPAERGEAVKTQFISVCPPARLPAHSRLPPPPPGRLAPPASPPVLPSPAAAAGAASPAWPVGPVPPWARNTLVWSQPPSRSPSYRPPCGYFGQ